MWMVRLIMLLKYSPSFVIQHTTLAYDGITCDNKYPAAFSLNSPGYKPFSHTRFLLQPLQKSQDALP